MTMLKKIQLLLLPRRVQVCNLYPMVYMGIDVVSNRQLNRQYKTCGSSYKLEPAKGLFFHGIRLRGSIQ